MRVGVDATSWVNRRGYGRFARNAVLKLVERDPDTTYVMYIDKTTAEEAALPPGAESRLIELSRPPSQAASATSSRSVSDLLRMTMAVRRDALDAFLFPSVYTYFPVLKVPTVVGVHDAIPSELPDLTFPGMRARLLWRTKEKAALHSATRLFTVSEASRTAISKRLGIAASRLALVPEAPDPVFRPASTAAMEAGRRSIGLRVDEPFLLYAGGISPHKNVETLIEAHALLGDARPRLVVVGDLERETYLSAAVGVRARVAALGLEQEVLLPGFVSDETLAALYSGALAVVIPSLAEGFGLPAVEAAACGAPTVLSDLEAHRATLGGAGVFFPPRDATRLAEEIKRLVDDPAARAEIALRCQAAVAHLRWDAAADSLQALIHDAAHLS
jgi:glycosyltransferase involved in cell wall biosynthesis